jgi:hypothetical protein
MLQFFFSHPGVFYGFGYDNKRNTKNERKIEHEIYTYFSDRSSFKKFPNYSGEKAADFGAHLFFKHYLSLFPNISSKEFLKEGIDSDLMGNYSLSVNSLIFLLFNYVQFLEDVKEKRFDDLIFFLKNFLNCIVEGDFLQFRARVETFDKDLQILSLKFENDENILLLLNILFLFLNVFEKRLGMDDNLDDFFSKQDNLTFSTFMDSCLIPEKIAQFNKIDDIVNLCYIFGKKLIDVRSVLMSGEGLSEYHFFKELDMDTYVYGAGFKFSLNRFFFKQKEKVFFFHNFDSYFKFFTYFPIVLHDIEFDHTSAITSRISDLESRFEFYEKRLDFTSVYLQRHPDLKYLIKLANEYETLKKLIIAASENMDFALIKNQYQRITYDRKLYDYFEFFDSNYIQFFSKKFNRIRHKLPTDTNVFDTLRFFDDVR